MAVRFSAQMSGQMAGWPCGDAGHVAEAAGGEAQQARRAPRPARRPASSAWRRSGGGRGSRRRPGCRGGRAAGPRPRRRGRTRSDATAANVGVGRSRPSASAPRRRPRTSRRRRRRGRPAREPAMGWPPRKRGSATAAARDAFTLPTSVTTPVVAASARRTASGIDEAGVATNVISPRGPARGPDHAPAPGRVDPGRVLVLAVDGPPAGREAEGDRPADEPQADDVGPPAASAPPASCSMPPPGPARRRAPRRRPTPSRPPLIVGGRGAAAPRPRGTRAAARRGAARSRRGAAPARSVGRAPSTSSSWAPRSGTSSSPTRAPRWPGRRCDVGRGGEEDADHVVVVRGRCARTGPPAGPSPALGIWSAGVLVERGGTPQGSHGHRADGSRRGPGRSRVRFAVRRAAATSLGRRRAPAPRRRSGAARRPVQAAVGERTDAHPHQPLHGVADRLAHAPDLTVAALVDGDAQHARLGLAHLGRGGDAVVELDAVAQPAQAPGARRPPRPGPGTPSRRRSSDGSGGGPGRRRW